MKSSFLCTLLILCLTLSTLTLADDFDKMIIRDMPREKIIEKYGRLPGQELLAEDLAALADSYFEGDTLRLLAIPVEWVDRPSTYSREDLEQLLFSRNELPEGSVADYFHEVSYGQIAVTGDVIDWYTPDWYNGGTYSPNFSYNDFAAIMYYLDPVIDYSQYDGNGDGDVDAICFIRSGNGEEDSGDPNDIWSYAISWPVGWGPFDGMLVKHWNTSPETEPLRDPDNPTQFSGESDLCGIRVFCHELSHNFGAPDLYDYDDKLLTSSYYTPNDNNDHPLVDWCVMGYGGYGLLSIGSEIPSHLCGWSKMKMGWIEPIELVGEHKDLVINNIETTNENALFKLPITAHPGGQDAGEYFLLEYRNPNSSAQFDKLDSDFSCYFWPDLTFGGDPLDRGLLICHVDDSVVNLMRDTHVNDGTPRYKHYTVMVEDAGYDPARDYTTNPEGRVTDSAQWWYPYETRRAALYSDDVDGQSEFGPNTSPNSDGYWGPSGIYVRVDSIVGDQMYVYVYNPVEVDYICGDANGDGMISQLDVAFLIAYLHKDGPAPYPLEAGDANGDGTVDQDDVKYLIEYLHKDGPEPVCPKPGQQSKTGLD